MLSSLTFSFFSTSAEIPACYMPLMTKGNFFFFLVERFPLRETGTLPFSQRERNVLLDTFKIH